MYFAYPTVRKRQVRHLAGTREVQLPARGGVDRRREGGGKGGAGGFRIIRTRERCYG